MIFHPNPMVSLKTGIWEDTHLKKIFVKPILVNNSKNPNRWVVFEKNGRGELICISNRHITEEQAVVTAQRIANRLYRRKVKGRKKKASPKSRSQLAPSDVLSWTNKLKSALESDAINHHDDARTQAKDVFDFLKNRYHFT